MENINKEIMKGIHDDTEAISFVLRADIYDNIKWPTVRVIERGIIREGLFGNFRNNFRRAIHDNIQNGKYK